MKLYPDEKLKLDKQDSTTLSSTLTSPNTIIELPTKSYVDSLHEIQSNRRELSSAINYQDNEFVNNKLTALDIVSVSRRPDSDNELATKNMLMIK